MAYDKRMDTMPLFISYPRTGAHWINCVMELYFDRPRLREGISFLEPNRTDWMWFHDHDFDLKIKHSNVLYLYRNPVSTVHSNLLHNYFSENKFRFSWLTLFRKKDIFSRSNIIEIAQSYHSHLNKWLLSNQKARTYVSHDAFVKAPQKEFIKICHHFDTDFNQERSGMAFGTVTKEALVKVTNNSFSMGKHMLKKSYKKSFSDFALKWGAEINEIVITDELKKFF